MKAFLRRLVPAMLLACGVARCAAPVVINDDGGWCWFEDERVLMDGGKLVAGTVASGTHDATRKGNVEVATYDLATGKASVFTLHRAGGDRAWMDDHNSPAFLVRPDGRFIVMYAKHGVEAAIYYRISTRPHDATAWEAEKVFLPSAASRVTYSNLHLLARENGGKGRIYDFFRGFDNSFKPSWAWSDDGGETWQAGRVFINVPGAFRHRPYAKYASDGTDTVHVAYTEGHPRNFDNSIYHIAYRGGKLLHSNGTVIGTLQEGLKAPEEGTRVYRGGPQNVAWTSDLHLDPQGRPVLVFSVQMNDAGKPPETSGTDLRYHYARWTGTEWREHEIAYAGTRLYQAEDDYTGNICLDPQDIQAVYISTNADPVTGKPLISKADGQRHWEIFRGITKDGLAWSWTAVTKNSRADNIRPVVPISKGRRSALLWLEGKMRAYTDYDFRVMGLLR